MRGTNDVLPLIYLFHIIIRFTRLFLSDNVLDSHYSIICFRPTVPQSKEPSRLHIGLQHKYLKGQI